MLNHYHHFDGRSRGLYLAKQKQYGKRTIATLGLTTLLLLSADERWRCGMLSLMIPSRKKLSTSHAFRDRRASFSCQGERFAHSPALEKKELKCVSSSLTSKTFSATKQECVPAFMLFTLVLRVSEILDLIGALLQQPSFTVRTENGGKSYAIVTPIA